ncbi:MAG: nitrogen regulation protein NR(II) [Terriglobales bacterium]
MSRRKFPSSFPEKEAGGEAAVSAAADQDQAEQIRALQQKIALLEADLAEHKHPDQATTMLAAIVESCDDAIVSKDLSGIVTSWNAGAERIFGYTAEEMIGRPITTVIPPELHSDEQCFLKAIQRGERIEHFETVRVRKDGERIFVSITISPVRDAEGRIIGAAKVARDISDRKRALEALRRAEKLAATGQLASIIAHEINNPMQALANLLALIAGKTSLDEEARQFISLADAELARMSHIARQMLSFYRSSAKLVPARVDEIMQDALQLFEKRMQSKDIALKRRFEFLGQIKVFPVEIGQLCANLVGNAVEATEQCGQIQVRIRAGRDWKHPERRGVRIVVADNGCGIRQELRDRVFDPFFTTKDEKGTGLGLWVVKGIVNKHSGSIRVRSSTSRRTGTVFSIFLPGSAAEGSSLQAAAQDHPAA